MLQCKTEQYNTIQYNTTTHITQINTQHSRQPSVRNITKKKGQEHILYPSYNKIQQDALFLNFILVKNSTCFGQSYCPSSGVLILYSQKLVFVILDMFTVC